MITQVTTHAADGLALLLQQYKGQPNLEAFLSTYLSQVQELENVLFDVLSIVTDVDSQVGEQLDLLGRLVGQPREGRIDTVYLLWIKARILITRSSGTPDELQRLLSLVAPDNAHTVTEYYPASLLIGLAGAFADDPEALASVVGEIVGAGINAQLLYALSADAEVLTFATGDVEEASATQGLGDDARTTGGKLADAKET